MPFPQGLAGINRIEQIDRVVHATSSGIEVTRTFWVWPYESWPRVTTALQGSVVGGKRIPPARDTYIDNCYCNETRVTMPPDSLASSHELTAPGADEPDDAATVKERIRAWRENPGEDSAGDVSFAVVTAHYRPLITAWESTDPDEAGGQAFDWLDPTFTPGMREIPWPTGLFVNVDRPPPFSHANVDQNNRGSFSVPIEDISIRRILVNEIPRKAIDQCLGAVNSVTFPPDPVRAPGFPKSRPKTLRFFPPDIRPMVDAGGNRWFEITYHFRRLAYWSNIVMDDAGRPETGAAGRDDDNKGWITWNHQFMQPAFAELGWYPVNTERQLRLLGFALPDFIPGFPLRAGRLHNEADFGVLFPEGGNPGP